MFPEILLIITLIFSTPYIYKKIKIDQLSKIFLILFMLLAFEIIFIYQVLEFQTLKNLLIFRFLLFSFIISFFFEDKNFLNQVLSSGAIRARQISQNTISDVYKIAGMI